MKEETMNTKRITAVIVTLFLALVIMVTPVLAGKPHFGKANASGSLTVELSSSGLYSLSASANRDAIYACKPAVGDFPPNPIPQEEVTDTVYGGGGFIGHCEHDVCRGVITITPPATSLSCDGDTVVTLAMITYSEVFVFGGYPDMNWLFKKIHGTYSETYYGYTP
jgi:hypothetical protein